MKADVQNSPCTKLKVVCTQNISHLKEDKEIFNTNHFPLHKKHNQTRRIIQLHKKIPPHGYKKHASSLKTIRWFALPT